MENRLKTTISMIRKTMPKDVYNRLTRQKLFPEDRGLEHDLMYVSNSLRKWIRIQNHSSISNVRDQIRLALVQGKKGAFQRNRRESILKTLVLSAISVNDIQLKQALLQEVISHDEGVYLVLDLLELLDGFQGVLLRRCKEDSNRDSLDRLTKSIYYSSLYPLLEMDDYFLSYLYVLELGRYILEFITEQFVGNKRLVLRMLDYLIEALNVQEEDKDLTDLQKLYVSALTDHFIIYGDTSESIEVQMETLADALADFLNAKVWMLKTYLSAMGLEPDEFHVSDLEEYELLNQLITEFLTPPSMYLFSSSFDSHSHFIWSEYDLSAPLSLGMLEFLVMSIFRFVNHDVKIDAVMFEGMFEILQMPIMDVLETRKRLLSTMFYSQLDLNFSLRSHFIRVFNAQMERLESKGYPMWSSDEERDEEDTISDSEIDFSELLLAVVQELDERWP